MYNKFRDYARTNGNPIGETGQTIKTKLLTTKYVICDRIQQNGKRQLTYKINRAALLTYITKKNLI
jgi:hypothetical protein